MRSKKHKRSKYIKAVRLHLSIIFFILPMIAIYISLAMGMPKSQEGYRNPSKSYTCQAEFEEKTQEISLE